MRTLSDNVLYAPNVADTAAFATALHDGPLDPAIAALPRPRVVFTGAVVATKLDVSLLAAVARARPAYAFALVGPTGMGDPSTDVSALEAVPNIHLLGGRHRDELPAVLRGADAGIIPYASNQLTGSIFPMKVYEYLAAGLPVVASGLPALRDVEAVASAGDPEAFAVALDEALAADDDARRAARSAAAAAHSWDARLAEIGAAVAALGR
jgi:glycosyltransferase involved in cell wall biosynthesis